MSKDTEARMLAVKAAFELGNHFGDVGKLLETARVIENYMTCSYVPPRAKPVAVAGGSE